MSASRSRSWSAAAAPALLALALAGAGCATAPTAPTASPEAVTETPQARARRAREKLAEAVGRADAERARGGVDWGAAERRLRAVLELAELPEARYDLAVALQREGRLAEARIELERTLAARQLREAAVNLGVVLEAQGDLAAASRAYEAAAAAFPGEAVSRERLAVLRLEAGRLDDAWRWAREALLRDPSSTAASRTMIRVALARPDLDLARLVALRAQKVAPADPGIAYLAGEVLARAGDEAGAAAQWRRAAGLAPPSAAARAALLDASLRHARWEEAAGEARALLAAAPERAPGELALGIALRHLGKADEALAAYGAAERLSGGKLAEVHLARAILLMRDREDCAGAVEEFDRYERAIGPLLPPGSPAPALMRECQVQIEQGREAAEAARNLREAAARRAGATPAPAAAPAPSAPTTPAPAAAPAAGPSGAAGAAAPPATSSAGMGGKLP